MALIPILPVFPAGCYTTALGKGRAQDGRVGGNPTLAVWPEVALAALGYVDDHGAVPAAAVPPQPVGLVGARLDPFLQPRVAARREERENTAE